MRTPIRHIIAATATYYQLRARDLTGPSRNRSLAWPRQLAMHIANKDGRSMQDVANGFNRKCHTTVRHANAAVAKRRDAEQDYDAAQIMALAKRNWESEVEKWQKRIAEKNYHVFCN